MLGQRKGGKNRIAKREVDKEMKHIGFGKDIRIGGGGNIKGGTWGNMRHGGYNGHGRCVLIEVPGEEQRKNQRGEGRE